MAVRFNQKFGNILDLNLKKISHLGPEGHHVHLVVRLSQLCFTGRPAIEQTQET